MARCPDCNKYVSFEFADPEVNNLEVNEDGTVTAEVRIVNACAECSNELTEATLEMEETSADAAEHVGEGHELSVDKESVDRTDRQDGKAGTPSRYRRTFYGATLQVRVTCTCGGLDEVLEMADECPASGMDSLV